MKRSAGDHEESEACFLFKTPGKYRFISSAEKLSTSVEFRMTMLGSSLEIIRNVGSVPRNMVWVALRTCLMLLFVRISYRTGNFLFSIISPRSFSLGVALHETFLKLGVASSSLGGGAKSSVGAGGGFLEDAIVAVLVDGLRGSRVIGGLLQKKHGKLIASNQPSR